MRKVRDSLALACWACAGALLVASCGEPVSGPTLVLTLASPDGREDPNGVDVTHFAAEVQRLSEGSIRVDPRWDVEPGGVHDWDQHLARRVASGDFDMALVPTRAWDVLGVRSLRALDTPFLVTDDELLETVLDSDLRGDLMSGLPEAGVVGVDLFPGDLRHPFGYRRPMVESADYRGAVVRAPTSATTRMFLERLGATVVDDDSDPHLRGAESGYGLQQGAVVTGNVTFFPKTEALVIDADVQERLRDDQWQLLQRAAAQTRTWLAGNRPSDAERAAEFCEQHGRIVAARDAQIATFQPAARYVRAELEKDDETRRIIGAIDDLKAASGGGADPVTRCPREQATVPTGVHALDGVYTSRVTAKALRAAGFTDAARIREDAARYVWTLDGGIWRYRATADHYLERPTGSGHYTYDNGDFTFFWPDNTHISARLEIGDDGTIHFHDLVDSVPELQPETDGFWSAPWRRIADLPD